LEPVLLDRNENRYGPAPGCRALLREVGPELLFNYTRDFQKGYYSALSQRLAELHGVEEKRVVLGYGCEDLLKQAVHHWVRPGERCLIPSASWWYYRAIADEVDGVTVEYPVHETPTSYLHDVDAMVELHKKSRARLLLIATPNNPTGNAFPTERLPELLEHFRDATVVLDQAYYGLADQPSEDLARLTEDHPNLMVLRSFSKLYGLAGVRVGYAVVGRGLGSFLRFAARNLGFSRLSERLALAALDDAAYYEAVRQRIVADRRRYYDALRGFPGTRVYDSQANFVLVRFAPGVAAPLQKALLGRGLVIKFFDEPAFAGCARITLGTESENARLIGVLSELLGELSARPLASVG
jgi:histidinol-phosphate aminotransferase